ncbi:DUF4919 domain-containing protein [Agaribacter marinus]|uniref:DUF4919 domain-containing protein n=1 Tax=Agaribacter marinus TaxID=1431249 RepID=A0AA37WHP6_9ALTE|nr:DUF4919 domain-containing protein [Agaribacter marinus]GLR71341.1 hypothetical protein GCM10007852_22490 [Agaribacter marinus]
MLKRLFICCFILLLGACGATDKSTEPKQVLNYAKSDADFRALATKIRNQSASPEDVDRILRLYPLTSSYRPESPAEQSAKVKSEQFIQQNSWLRCIQINRQLLQTNFTSLIGHYGMAICSQEAGDNASAQYHNWVLDAFIEAIWRSGDGQTPETAFYINSTHDLYAFIQLHQLMAVEQALIYRNKLPIQKVIVQNPESQKNYTWYFDLTPQFRRAHIDKLEGRTN